MASGVTKERVIRELARIAFLELDEQETMPSAKQRAGKGSGLSEGEAKMPAQPKAGEGIEPAGPDPIPAAKQRAKQSGGVPEREVKLSDQLKALELLGRRLGLFTDGVGAKVSAPRIIDDVGSGEIINSPKNSSSTTAPGDDPGG